MKKKKNFLPVFLTFFVIAVLLFILSSAGVLNGFSSFFENGTVSMQRAVFGVVRYQGDDSSEVSKLREENKKLTAELARRAKQEQEAKALQDQFKTSTISSATLLPAVVIGMAGDRITIDKGQNDGVQEGRIVIVNDNLIGRVNRASTNLSVVDLITSKNISLTAKKLNSASVGVIKGAGNGVILDNVLLSEKLEKGDLILTKGNVDEEGKGFPPDLIVGKVAGVNKKPSSLFQTAEVKSLIDFSRIRTVFVIVQ